jgi:hypothetical protein
VATPAPPSTARPAAPAPAGRGAQTGGKDRAAAANGNGTGAPPPVTTGPPTTATTAGAPPPPDPAAADAAAVSAAQTAPPAPAPPPAVEPIDQAILDNLASAPAEKPPDDGSQLLLGAGIALALFLAAVAGWAWYHRSSRYMPA